MTLSSHIATHLWGPKLLPLGSPVLEITQYLFELPFDFLKKYIAIDQVLLTVGVMNKVLGWPKSSFGFFHTMALVVLGCL